MATTSPSLLTELSNRPVRPVLHANAAFCAVSAVVALAASGSLSEWLDIDRRILLVVGVGLLAYAPLVALFARRRPLRRAEVLTVFAGDLAWCVGAVTLVAWPGLLSGTAKLALAAVSIPVVIFTDLEWMRRDNLD